MQKDSREREWKSTVKASKDNKKVNFDDDINNLNSDDSFKPIDETEEKVPLTEEEKKEVRKKLFVLLILIVVVLIFMLVVLIFDPFSESSNSSDTKEEEEETVDSEEDEEILEEDTLMTKEDGTISLTDSEVSNLITEVTFKSNEYYDNDTVSLFSSSGAVNSLTDINKLFLMAKTSEFNTIVESNIEDSSICNSSIEIGVVDVNNILLNRFNTTITNYESFIYSYYDGSSFISNIKFTYDSNTNKYVGTCYTNSNSITSFAENEVYKAEKSGNYLYLYSYVVFINKTGVYKDTDFKTLITNDETATSSVYMSSGNTYIYTYNISGDNYYLESISLSS